MLWHLALEEFLAVRSQSDRWSLDTLVHGHLWIPDPSWELVALRRNWTLMAVLSSWFFPGEAPKAEELSAWLGAGASPSPGIVVAEAELSRMFWAIQATSISEHWWLTGRICGFMWSTQSWFLASVCVCHSLYHHSFTASEECLWESLVCVQNFCWTLQKYRQVWSMQTSSRQEECCCQLKEFSETWYWFWTKRYSTVCLVIPWGQVVTLEG